MPPPDKRCNVSKCREEPIYDALLWDLRSKEATLVYLCEGHAPDFCSIMTLFLR